VTSSDSIQVTLEESRYDRQERVSWWDQKRLKEARVLVVGAGALGNEVVKNLVLVGVGNIAVIDMDFIESSNLARCVFFRPEDEGQAKASVLAKRAGELNKDVVITGIVDDIRVFGTGIGSRVDVIVGALDNREARLFCNRLAARNGVRWVDGAIEAMSGVARVFFPPSSCYECTLSEGDWEALAHRQSCRLLSRDELNSGKVPTTASTSSVIAGIQSQEVVKILHRDRIGVAPLQGGIVFDGANNDTYTIKYPSNEDCMAHEEFTPRVEIELTESDFHSIDANFLVKKLFGEEKNAIVSLGDDHVVGWNCTKCEVISPEGRAATLIKWGDGICSKCQEPRMPTLLTSIQVPGEYSSIPLSQLGVRRDEILSVRMGVDERYVWLGIPDKRLPNEWTKTRTLVEDENV
jgi:adenylyltransferase/sulfurtransferase